MGAGIERGGTYRLLRWGCRSEIVAPPPCKKLAKPGWQWLDRLMGFEILGPLAAYRDGSPLPLGGPKQRKLLGVLLVHANEVVSRDRLIDTLWGERPPASAPESLD